MKRYDIYTKEDNDDDNKKYHKVRYHCHYTEKHRVAAHSISNIRYKTLKKKLL